MADYRSVRVDERPELKKFLERLESLEAAPIGSKGKFEDEERELAQCSFAASAEALSRRLQQYDVDAPAVQIGGVEHRRKLRCEREYMSRFGAMRIMRTLYVPRGSEGRVKCPMDLQAGIIDGRWTPAAAKLMSMTVAHVTPGEAVALFNEMGGIVASTSSLDRLPKELSEQWEQNREEFERELRVVETIPAEATTIAISIDGVLAPMKDANKEAQPDKAKREQGPRGYREIGCGTVSLFDRFGERLDTKRYARMPETHKTTVKQQVIAEAQSALREIKKPTVVLLADGAPDNWTIVDEIREKLGVEDIEQVLDCYHALASLKRALDAYHGEGSPRSRSAFEEYRVTLKEDFKGHARVVRALRHRASKSSGTARKTISTTIEFFEKNKDRMRYAEMLIRRLPIGSGIVEAACKTLVTTRMKRSGMSWRKTGGQAILTFRSLLQSKRWNNGWELLANQYIKRVTPVRAAGNEARRIA